MPLTTWIRAIERAGITNQQMGQAVATILDTRPKYPPNLPEFMNLCEGKTDDGYLFSGQKAAQKPVNEVLALPSADSTTERKMAELSKLNAILGGRSSSATQELTA